MDNDIRFLTEDVTPYLDAAKFELAVSALPLSRAARIRAPRSPLDRARRLAAEVALRKLLREAGETYRALTVAYTDLGKPYFAGRRDLALSFSHSGFLAAAALTRAPGGVAPAVGIDLEEVPTGKRAEKYGALAERFFSAGFLEELRRATPEERPRVFTRLWCLTEAATKAAGSGALDFAAAETILSTASCRETRQLLDGRGAEYALALVVTGGVE